MKPGYLPETLEGKLLWLGEEAAELSQAIFKTLRFAHEKEIPASRALHLYNPDAPVEARETNHAWILRELEDLKAAIVVFDDTDIACIDGNVHCEYLPHQTFTCYRCQRLRCFCMGSDAQECVSCSLKRKNARAEKKRQSKARSSRPKRKREAAGKQST